MSLRLGPLAIVAGVACVTSSALYAVASPGNAPVFYRCEVNGKRVTSDRPVPECRDRDQEIIGADGLRRGILGPSLTPDEQAELEAKKRRDEQLRVEQKDAQRRDRNLVLRFPTEAAHQQARSAALDDARTSIDTSQKRLAVLAAERKPLNDEAEFYTRREMPAKLRQALDANDAATEAQRALIQNQQGEMVRINTNYDAELARLRRLWASARAGSLGVINAAPGPASAPAAKAASNR